ncbi:MAG: sigma-70 family RNA polymerase sigma factor [Cyanobacteria bacterium P01_E01_bin.42]
MQPRKQKCDSSTGKLRQNRGTAIDSEDIVSQFWQLWQGMHDQLYRCCLKLMNYNSMDAEDALSQAMLKARDKVQQYWGKIRNLKAWLMQVTRNLCIDIIRKRSKEAAGVDSLEWVGETENAGATNTMDTPEKVLETEERAIVIREAIASLPERLHQTFILHFYQQRTHTEIAEAQGITYDNVCKRISLARKHLKEKLRSYFQGTDGDVSHAKSRTVKTTSTPTKSTCAKLNTSDETLVLAPFSGCDREAAEKESVEEVEVETSELVEGAIESKEFASQTIQETATVSVKKYVEGVKIEKHEFLESYVQPREIVSQIITEVGDRNSDLLELSKLLAVRRGEPREFIAMSVYVAELQSNIRGYEGRRSPLDSHLAGFRLESDLRCLLLVSPKFPQMAIASRNCLLS